MEDLYESAFLHTLRKVLRVTRTVATAGAAFPSEIYHTLAKLCLFSNFLGCDISRRRLGAPEF
jgi:hypothetical protein